MAVQLTRLSALPIEGEDQIRIPITTFVVADLDSEHGMTLVKEILSSMVNLIAHRRL